MWLIVLAHFMCLAHLSQLTSAYNAGDLKARDTLPTPISVPPSQDFNGNDGPWSSFIVQVGSPAQVLRLFISTALSTTWVIIPAGCPASDTACPNDRGGIYNASESSTWRQQGEYQLSAEETPNVTSYGLFGNDTVGLQSQANIGPVLQNQIIGGIAAEQLWLGLFGVNPKPTNLNSSNPIQPSYTATLRQQNLIPSISYGYTAGNKYSLKTVLGSLILGGYDSARFAPNDITFPLASDDFRGLSVGIQAINSVDTTGKSYDLLGTTPGIMTYIDSTLAELWLPATACTAFEDAFGLVYDSVNKLYPVNSTLHTELQTLNPNVTFTIGPGISGGSTVNIVLPYAAFDLEANWPKYPNDTLYFPLQRAENSSQYTLGRTFLQEAYLIVDYERSNFSVSQCIFPDNLDSTIVAIPAPSNSTTNSTSSQSTSTSTPDPNKTIGIAIGVALGLLFIVSTIALFLIIRRKSSRYSSNPSSHQPSLPRPSFRSLLSRFRFSSPSIHLYRPPKVELNTDAEHSRFEVPGSEPLKPISETSTLLTEPLFTDQALPVSELHSNDRPAVAELHSPSPAVELPTAIDNAHILLGPSHTPSPITGPWDETRTRYTLSDPVAAARVDDRRAPKRRLSERPLLHKRQSTLESVESGPSAPSGSVGVRSPSEGELEEGFFSPISPVGEGREWFDGGK